MSPPPPPSPAQDRTDEPSPPPPPAKPPRQPFNTLGITYVAPDFDQTDAETLALFTDGTLDDRHDDQNAPRRSAG